MKSGTRNRPPPAPEKAVRRSGERSCHSKSCISAQKSPLPHKSVRGGGEDYSSMSRDAPYSSRAFLMSPTKSRAAARRRPPCRPPSGRKGRRAAAFRARKASAAGQGEKAPSRRPRPRVKCRDGKAPDGCAPRRSRAGHSCARRSPRTARPRAGCARSATRARNPWPPRRDPLASSLPRSIFVLSARQESCFAAASSAARYLSSLILRRRGRQNRPRRSKPPWRTTAWVRQASLPVRSRRSRTA